MAWITFSNILWLFESSFTPLFPLAEILGRIWLIRIVNIVIYFMERLSWIFSFGLKRIFISVIYFAYNECDFQFHNFKISFLLSLNFKLCLVSKCGWFSCKFFSLILVFLNWVIMAWRRVFERRKAETRFLRGKNVIWCMICWRAIYFLPVSRRIKRWQMSFEIG